MLERQTKNVWAHAFCGCLIEFQCLRGLNTTPSTLTLFMHGSQTCILCMLNYVIPTI